MACKIKDGKSKVEKRMNAEPIVKWVMLKEFNWKIHENL